MTLPTSNPRPFYFKLAMVLISIIALGYISILGKEVLCPLLFGLLFSILLLPLANFFEQKLRFPRNAASAISVLLLVLSIAAVIFVVGSQISSLSRDLPLLKQQIGGSLRNFQEWISTRFHVDIEKQMDYVNSATSKIANSAPTVIGATVVSLSGVLLFLVFITFDTFFMLFYRRRLLKFMVDVFREKNSEVVYDIVAKVQFIIRKYIVGIFLEMATVAFVCCSVFLILGIKYAILLGLITALFNVIPYIGIFTALFLNIFITFATTGAAAKVVLVAITVVSMHLIDSNILLPLIVGSKVRINAFITLLGVVIGELIWGIPGMFLSIPAIAIAKIIFDRIDGLRPWGTLLGDEKDSIKSFRPASKLKGRVQ